MCRRYACSAICASLAMVVAGCGPDYPSCEKDEHCHEGEYCVNNRCQQCRDDGDCPEGQECAAGACREIPGYCRTTADCADGSVCRDGRCGPCLSAADCPDGKVCLDGLCAEAECRSTEDCPAGLSCVNYRCEVDKSLQSELGQGDCRIESVYFDFDSAEVSREMRRILEQNYDCIMERGGRVVLEGHCDPRGTTEYNMALGDRRGRMACKILATLGLEGSRMRVVSKGEEEASGRDEEGWARDRRVDFE